MMTPTHQTPATEQASPTSTDESESATGRQKTAGATRESDAPPRTIAKDDAFHILQNARRRAVLRYLLDHPDRARFQMRDLAEVVAAWEHDTTVQQLTSEQRQRVYIALYQSHLTKLDEHGVIRYNQPRGIVEPTALLAAFEPFLEDGLHADTRDLTVETAFEDPSAETSCSQESLVHTLSSLLTR